MVKRVSKQQIVKPAPIVLSTQNPDAIFVKDNPEVVFTNITGNMLQQAQIGAFNIAGSNDSVLPIINPAVAPKAPAVPELVTPDVPDISDIESISYEEYADANGVAKYKAVIKIRNSSEEKTAVAGVDARVYNPNGSNQYNLGSGSASSGSSVKIVSSFISNATWYKATATYDSFAGSVYSAATISANDQYPSDGSTVPADSNFGISTKLRTVEAWRKTQSEALAAVEALYAPYIV